MVQTAHALRPICVDDYVPAALPPHWTRRADAYDVAVYTRQDRLRVIVSTAEEADGRSWMHISVAREQRLPSWQDLRDAHDLFAGLDRFAYQVISPNRAHYS